jgi:hypothetical protein
LGNVALAGRSKRSLNITTSLVPSAPDSASPSAKLSTIVSSGRALNSSSGNFVCRDVGLGIRVPSVGSDVLDEPPKTIWRPLERRLRLVGNSYGLAELIHRWLLVRRGPRSFFEVRGPRGEGGTSRQMETPHKKKMWHGAIRGTNECGPRRLHHTISGGTQFATVAYWCFTSARWLKLSE